MSMQEINLYLAELHPQKQYFTATFALVASICLVLVLALIQAAALHSSKNFEANVALLENQKVITSERLAKIKSMPLTSNALLLDRRIAQLNAEITSREEVGKIIEWQTLGNNEGFAHVLVGLARHSNRQFSLEHLRISAGGKMLELEGETRQIEEIPLYLQRLQAEKNFAQIRFGLMSMAKKEKRGKAHKFSLGFETVYELVEGHQ